MSPRLCRIGGDDASRLRDAVRIWKRLTSLKECITERTNDEFAISRSVGVSGAGWDEAWTDGDDGGRRS